MADNALHITDPGILPHFANELGRFAGNVRETLTAIDSRMRAALATLADRESDWQSEVQARQRACETADEDDRAAAYRALEEAQSCLHEVRHWQDRLLAAAEH